MWIWLIPIGFALAALSLREQRSLPPTVAPIGLSHKIPLYSAITSSSPIGLVLPLTPQEIVKRAMFLAGQGTIADLDAHVKKDALTLAVWGYKDGSSKCLSLFYQLSPHNGGRDPKAPDPGERWIREGGSHVNRTVDCSGGVAWMCGFDRFQPVRAKEVYGGWLNTDSKIELARKKRKCFLELDAPELGCIITCKTGSVGHVGAGHEGVVVGLPLRDWDPADVTCWKELMVVDCAARGTNPANSLTNGLGWYQPWITGYKRDGKSDTCFLRNIMKPEGSLDVS